MIGEIITEHRERMLNLKKYYPFFKLIDTSFSQFKEGRYEALDMGYIVMAVLRFFIEENNFKEKEVTYKEYQEFFNNIIRHDFDMKLTEEESGEVADYVFDKMKNEGKPFEYAYYDPVEKKKRVSRVKLIESTIKDNTVWYSISADAVEFYLDTKEIKDESRISVSQLLLEKMINSNNFKGGVEVIERINEEVGRLKVKKNEVMDMLSKDVKTGLEHYEDFVNTGMKWFVDEEKLFKKNKELIDKAIERLESNSSATESYYRTLKEIHYLEDQLKIAMNKHAELLRDCTDMQNKTDEAVKKAKLSRLRPHMDFTAALSDMIRTDDASLLSFIIEPLLKLNIKKTFDIKTIDEALLVKPARYDKKEYVTEDTPEDIVYEDEIEDERIRHNYIFIMNNLKECINRKCMNKSDILTLGEFNNIMSEAYGEEILNNADYYSFFVNLCQKDSYVIGGDNMQSETFLDDILKEGFEGSEPVHIIMEKGTDEIIDYTNVQVMNITFKRQTMENRNLEKALDIVSKLITGEELTERGDNSSLYQEYNNNAEIYDIVHMSLKKLNLSIYEYNNGLYVSAGENNRVFGYTNEELRKELGIKVNKDLYMAYFVIYNIITEFYTASSNTTYVEFVKVEDIVKNVDYSVSAIIDKKLGMIIDDIEENSFKQIALSWDELPVITVEDTADVRAARNSKTGFVKMVLNFCVSQGLLMEAQSRYYPTDRFKALIENYFDEYKGRMAEIMQSLI